MKNDDGYDISPESKSTLQQVVRIAGWALSGYLAGKGVDSGQAIEIVSSAVIALVTLGSWINWQFKRKSD